MKIAYFGSRSFLHVGVGYDYNETECTCGSQYCKCREITSAWATDIDLPRVVQSLGLDPADSYVADRLLRIHRAFDPKRWTCVWDRGYYGEEVKAIHLDGSNVIDGQLATIIAMPTLGAKIEALLTAEYGHVLPVLRGRQWRPEVIDKDDLIFCQQSHYRRVDQAAIEAYREYPFARGVVIPSATVGMYDLIDGYHRCAAGDGQITVFVGAES